MDISKELKDIFPIDDKKTSKHETYDELQKKKEELEKKNGEYLFQNIKLGEERGKAESEIKLLQAKVVALKAAETYLDTLLEETQKGLSQVESSIRQLEKNEEKR